MSLKQETDCCLSAVGKAFDTFFNLNYYFCSGTGKTSLLDAYPFIYYKWLSAVVYDKLPVTVYGLLSEVSARNLEKGRFGFPYVKPNSFYRYKNFETKIVYHSFEDHPVIEDLKKFLDIISKYERITQTEIGELLLEKEAVKKLKTSLSTYSPYYTEFLGYLACELKLIEVLPSINISVFRVSAGYENFFEGKNIFKKVFDACVRLCRDNINELFPPESPFFTADIIKELLTHPTETGNILDFILSDYGFDEEDYDGGFEFPDIEELGLDDPDLDDEEFAERLCDPEDKATMRMTSIYVLSAVISKWFYIVFGYYLHLIRPFGGEESESYYTMQFFLQNRKNMDYRQKEAVFTILPIGYNLTPFGLAFFEIPQNPSSGENEILSKLSLRNSFEEFVDHYGIAAQIPGLEIRESQTETYILKIYNEEAKKPAYKYFEFTEYNLLRNLCAAVCRSFRIKKLTDYSIFTDEGLSPFSEYTSIANEVRTHKKAEATFLNEVFSKIGDKIWLRIKSENKRTGEKISCFTAELIETGKKQRGREYPVVREKIK